jgi:hypothetical protein
MAVEEIDRALSTGAGWANAGSGAAVASRRRINLDLRVMKWNNLLGFYRLPAGLPKMKLR